LQCSSTALSLLFSTMVQWIIQPIVVLVQAQILNVKLGLIRKEEKNNKGRRREKQRNERRNCSIYSCVNFTVVIYSVNMHHMIYSSTNFI
jgi:hypothetical protein